MCLLVLRVNERQYSTHISIELVIVTVPIFQKDPASERMRACKMMMELIWLGWVNLHVWVNAPVQIAVNPLVQTHVLVRS